MDQSTPPNAASAKQQKQEIRRQIGIRRRSQSDKDNLSKAIQNRLMELKQFKAAKTILFYIDMRSEVRTRVALVSALASDKKTVVPFCNEGRLDLFHLEHAGELAIGSFGVLEPRVPLRTVPEKAVSCDEIDLAVVPGVAFDRQGNRLGHGKAYYDGLLRRLSSKTMVVGLAYECQIVPDIPLDDHDMPVNIVITEQAIYERPSG
jgi:5-formyltetrahydrofolate cyclo-ligase